MSEPIDHYTKAVELAKLAEENVRQTYGSAEDAKGFTRLAKLHLDLHAARDSDSDYWEMAGRREALVSAVRPALGYLDQSPGGRTIADKLRELIDGTE